METRKAQWRVSHPTFVSIARYLTHWAIATHKRAPYWNQKSEYGFKDTREVCLLPCFPHCHVTEGHWVVAEGGCYGHYTLVVPLGSTVLITHVNIALQLPGRCVRKAAYLTHKLLCWIPVKLCPLLPSKRCMWAHDTVGLKFTSALASIFNGEDTKSCGPTVYGWLSTLFYIFVSSATQLYLLYCRDHGLHILMAVIWQLMPTGEKLNCSILKRELFMVLKGVEITTYTRIFTCFFSHRWGKKL